MTTTRTDNDQMTALTEAYHAVFDVKDAQEPGTPAFYLAYETARSIANLIAAVGGTAPIRYDRQGRQ